jgi:5-methylthioadenosine/S-adenosylhomocysteine deaminase
MPTLIPIDSLIHARFIVPVRPKKLVLENHCVAIKNGKILEVLPSILASDKYLPEAIEHLDKHCLTPGLVNAHGHTAMSLFRGIADDLPLMEWLNDHIWPAEGQWVSEDFVRDGTELAIAEMIRSGTTCFSDMYFFPNISAEVAKNAGIRAQLCCPILDFPTIWGSGPEEYLDKALQLAIEYADDEHIEIGLGPHAPYTVSDKPLENIRDLALENSLPVQIHLHETQAEVADAVGQSGVRPIQRLKDIGLLSRDIPLQCVHMTALNDEDIAILKDSSASVIHCPESNLKLASGFCEVDKLLRNDINVALGTDGAASNNDLDMFGEMRTAALIAKPIAQNAAAVDAATALDMATINGATALGLESLIGSLEVGKSADMIAINLNELNSQPSYDPISDIVYSVSAQQVTHSWVNGRPLLSKGELVNMDAQQIIGKAVAWADKINTK